MKYLKLGYKYAKKHNLHVGLIWFIAFCGSLQAQDIQDSWIFNNGGIDMDCGYSIDTDRFGAVYVAGRFADSINIDGIILKGKGSRDDQAFVAKFDQNGNAIWAHSAIGTDDKTAYNVRVNKEQNIIVSGVTSGSIEIGDTTITLPWGKSVLFIAEFDSDGEFKWAKTYGSTERGDQGNESKEVYMTLDNNDNILVTGQFNSWDTHFDDIHVEVPYGFRSYFYIVKFDKKGNALWANAIQAENQSEINGVAVDDEDNVLIVGYHYRGDLTINNTALNIADKNYTGYVMKFNSGGQYLWHKGSHSYPKCITTDTDNNYYVAGNNSIEKFEVDGLLIWEKPMYVPLSAMFFDVENNLHLAGTDRLWNGDMIIGTDTVSFGDSFIASLTANGDVSYIRPVGEIQTFFCDLTVNIDGNPFVTGTYFDGAIISDSVYSELLRVDSLTGESFYRHFFYESPLKSNGYLDMFVAKFSKTKNTSTSIRTSNLLKDNVLLYPNPATSNFHISFKEKMGDPTEISIINVNGKPFFHKTINHLVYGSPLNINCNNWPKGFYVCKVKQSNYVGSFKLVIK